MNTNQNTGHLEHYLNMYYENSNDVNVKKVENNTLKAVNLIREKLDSLIQKNDHRKLQSPRENYHPKEHRQPSRDSTDYPPRDHIQPSRDSTDYPSRDHIQSPRDMQFNYHPRDMPHHPRDMPPHPRDMPLYPRDMQPYPRDRPPYPRDMPRIPNYLPKQSIDAHLMEEYIKFQDFVKFRETADVRKNPNKRSYSNLDDRRDERREDRKDDRREDRKIERKPSVNIKDFYQKYVNKNFSCNESLLNNYDSVLLIYLKILNFGLSVKVMKEIPRKIRNLIVQNATVYDYHNLSNNSKDYLDEIIKININSDYKNSCTVKDVVNLLTSFHYLNMKMSEKLYISKKCCEIIDSIGENFIKQFSKPLYMDNNVVFCAGIILYKEDNGIKLLVTEKNGTYSDFGCRVDIFDNNLRNTASKKLYEESRTNIDRNQIENRLNDNYIYFADAKCLVFYVKATDKEANMDLNKFENKTFLTESSREIKWIDIDDFTRNKIYFRSFDTISIDKFKARIRLEIAASGKK